MIKLGGIKILNKKIFCIVLITILISVLGISAYSTYSPNSINLDSIEKLKIVKDQAILKGMSQQMKIQGYEETPLFGSVVWSSNNESVISCTKYGEIKGLKKGYADITVKAVFGDAKDTIRVYCAEKLNNPVTAGCTTPLILAFRAPSLFQFQKIFLNFGPHFPLNEFSVLGAYDSFFYVTHTKNGNVYEYFMYQRFFADNIASGELFKQLSAKELVVFSGESSSQKLTTNYTGHVSWKVSDESVVYYNHSTGAVTAKKPGTAIISATAQGKTLYCMVFSVSNWYEPETSISKNTIYVRSIPAMTGKIIATLPAGTSITAKGDMENEFGWIYITSDSADGFILLSDFPGIDYLFSEYHYYDQGFDVRYDSPISKIYDYASVLNDVMMDSFRLKVCPYVESYTSTADLCKIQTYGSVSPETLFANCPQSKNHFLNSCLQIETMCDDMLNKKGKGSFYVGRCIWTGHLLENDTTSMANLKLKSIVFTIKNVLTYDPTKNIYINAEKIDFEKTDYTKSYTRLHICLALLMAIVMDHLRKVFIALIITVMIVTKRKSLDA